MVIASKVAAGEVIARNTCCLEKLVKRPSQGVYGLLIHRKITRKLPYSVYLPYSGILLLMAAKFRNWVPLHRQV